MQSHTKTHLVKSRGWNRDDPDAIENEYRDSKERIEAEIPGRRCLTLAYSGGGAKTLHDPDLAAKCYIACRGGGGYGLARANQIDYNGFPLTYEFVVLRGDSSKVRMTPLNEDGSLMEIEMDYFESFTVDYANELSNMLVIGVFANNGHYDSAPSFITCSTFWNESRTYSGGRLDQITYEPLSIDFNVTFERAWSRDIFELDAMRIGNCTSILKMETSNSITWSPIRERRRTVPKPSRPRSRNFTLC